MTISQDSWREYVLSALEKHERHLTRYAARMLGGNLDGAEDVVQFAFMKLCQQGQKKPDRQLKAWLYTVCRNRIIDEFRKRGRQISIDPVHFETTLGHHGQPQQDIERREWLQRVKASIDRLPDQDREIIDLWSNGLRHSEIAEIVSKKPGAVRVQLHRVIQLLKKELGVKGAERGMQNAE